jgi:predicted GIY-YIG superfamily endonuclease
MRSLLALSVTVLCAHGFQQGIGRTSLRAPQGFSVSYHRESPLRKKTSYFIRASSKAPLHGVKKFTPIGTNAGISTNSGVRGIIACAQWLQWSLMRLWGKWKAFIRARTLRYTVYILECQNNKYYVGSTTAMKRRWAQHQSERGGSKWTRLHKPIRIVRAYNRIPDQYVLGMEAKVTAETMLKFGINNVRGAMFAEPREYDHEDIRALTGFLGHYNNLGYQDVEEKLERDLQPTVPFSTSGSSNALNSPPRKRKKKRKSKDDICYNCGKKGHWAYQCPQVWGYFSNDRSLA